MAFGAFHIHGLSWLPASWLVHGRTSRAFRRSLFGVLAPFCFAFVTVQFRARAGDGQTLSRAADICALAACAELLFLGVFLWSFFSVPLPSLFVLVLHQ